MVTHAKQCACDPRLAGRRAFFACVAGGVAASIMPGAWALTQDVKTQDETFMRLALEEARLGDFPFGAVIVRDSKVAATGRNTGAKLRDPTAHGEMMAIRNYLSAGNDAALLSQATLYTSGEPCAMCMGAIIWCGFKRLVFAASVAQLTTKIDQINVSAADLATRSRWRNIEIVGGVLDKEAMALFDNK